MATFVHQKILSTELKGSHGVRENIYKSHM